MQLRRIIGVEIEVSADRWQGEGPARSPRRGPDRCREGLETQFEPIQGAVKELLPAALAEKSRVYLRDIPDEAEKLIWEMQAQALAPLVAGGKLGCCVLFQFPHWLTARRAHIRYLEQLRDRAAWPLAIEFRGAAG